MKKEGRWTLHDIKNCVIKAFEKIIEHSSNTMTLHLFWINKYCSTLSARLHYWLYKKKLAILVEYRKVNTITEKNPFCPEGLKPIKYIEYKKNILTNAWCCSIWHPQNIKSWKLDAIGQGKCFKQFLMMLLKGSQCEIKNCRADN